jgi:starch synthase (maltosyl-transferring)
MIPPIKTVIIENVQPSLDGGRYPLKREVGDVIHVTADVFKDGHDVLAVFLLYRKKGATAWAEVRMELVNNDLWKASFALDEIGRYQYAIRAYPDRFRSWLDEVQKKQQAGQDLASELQEGRLIIGEAKERASGEDRAALTTLLRRLAACRDQAKAVEVVSEKEIGLIMDRYPDEKWFASYEPVLEVVVDRTLARFAGWYEMFPRSQGRVPGRGSTFRDCEERLPEIKGMGFDVIYLPPIHPIGRTNRKGPNNTLKGGPNDPGSPWAIGNETGGHKAVEPELGTLKDFERFVRKCRQLDMEVALDFAINCSPDHPYVQEHPEWFFKRPDGTIKYAENPPKKYQDIYPLNFYCEDREGLWKEMKSIIEFWIQHGVYIFRVDNPHTKPVLFWEWMIGEIQAEYPEAIFLSEAFTRPKMMRLLAKSGFTQSYTYFTWRNEKQELTDYLVELTQGPMKEYFRGNFFANTPDILHAYLQNGGRPAFKVRAVLAATLSSVYGIYSGYELCENRAIPGTEDYQDSEKYQHKVWDWDRAGNIKDYLTRINQARRENPALHEYDNLEFYQADNNNILFYGKSTPDRSNNIMGVVNLDPHHVQESSVYVPIDRYGIPPDQDYQVCDLLTGQRYLWRGSKNYVRLDPNIEPCHLFRVCRWRKREGGFDYFEG